MRGIAEGRISPSILQGVKLPTEADFPGPRLEQAKLAESKDDAPRRKKFGGKKSRGPVNLDRQCGVINNKGLPCSRSLTCKSHSMGAKRNVAGRSQPYDTLLFEWQKATNPAFVARLEEKERAIAAAKSSNPKDRKRKASGHGDRQRDALSEQNSVRAVDGGNDMYMANASYQEVGRDMVSTLHTIHKFATRDRTTILPMAVRGFPGQYTTRAKRFRSLRQFLAQGLSGTAHMRALRTDETDTAAP